MSLNELNDILQEFFKHKQQHDLLQLQQNKQQETVAQHILTFMRRKQTERSACIEQTKNLLTAIKQYCKIDSDVGLCAKIIEHKVE
jgi:hypothetical protein